MAVLTYDSFTGAYSTDITTRDPEIGARHTRHPTQSGQVARIAWGGVYGAAAITVTGNQPATGNYEIECDYLPQLGYAPALYVRLDATALTSYICTFGGSTRFTRFIDGVQSGTSGTYAYTPPTGRYDRTDRLKVSVADEGGDVRLRAYINGVEVLTWLDDSAVKITAKGWPAFKVGAANTEWGLLDNLIVREPDATPALQIFSGLAKQVYQRDSVATNSTVRTFRGTYNGAPSGIEVQILDAADGTTVIQDWAPLSITSIGNGQFSGTLPCPNGAWYIAKARFANDTGVTSTQAHKWGIGVCILTFGQSNMANMFIYVAGSQTPDDKLVRSDYINGFVQNANWQGACPMGNEIVAATGLPVCLIDAAISGSSLENLTNGAGFWLNLSGVPYTRTVAIKGLIPKIEAAVWVQGEQEARTVDKVVTTNDYVANMETLFGRIRTLWGISDLPILITPLIINEETGDLNKIAEKWNNIRWGHMRLIEEQPADGYFWGGVGWEQGMAQTVHYNNYGTIGYRTGLAYTRKLGLRTFGRGPKILGYTPINSTTFDIKIQHDGATDFTPTTGIVGFHVYDDTVARTIASATRQDAETVRLVVDAAVTVPNIYHVYGCDTAKTAPLKDNSSAALPLWPSNGAIALYDAGEVDDTAPNLTDASCTATSPTTATGLVTTDDGNGTLYFLASANATETAATIKAALSQSVTSAGEQTISLSGLDADTTYYLHFVQINGAALESDVVSTTAWTTPEIVYPEISATTAAVDAHSVTCTVTTDTAGGVIYGLLNTSATTPSAATIVSTATDSDDVTDAGDYVFVVDDLDPRTTYYWHVVHVDGDDLASNVLTIPVTTLDISIALSFSNTAPAKLQYVLVTSDMGITAEEIEALWGIE